MTVSQEILGKTNKNEVENEERLDTFHLCSETYGQYNLSETGIGI